MIQMHGGIHYKNLRTEKENPNASGKLEPVNCRVQWLRKGWSLKFGEISGAEFQRCFIFFNLSGASKEGQKR